MLSEIVKQSFRIIEDVSPPRHSSFRPVVLNEAHMNRWPGDQMTLHPDLCLVNMHESKSALVGLSADRRFRFISNSTIRRVYHIIIIGRCVSKARRHFRLVSLSTLESSLAVSMICLQASLQYLSLSACMPAFLLACLCQTFSQLVNRSACMSVYPSVYLYVSLSVLVFVCVSIHGF